MVRCSRPLAANEQKSLDKLYTANQGRGMLPLFPHLSPDPPMYGREHLPGFSDPFLMELMHSRPVQRLKGIGFLGAIDYVRSPSGYHPHRRRHTRFAHSLGVARLALLYAERRPLPFHDGRVIAAAALLHDIGHGPLSHTLEPVFAGRYGFTHHQVGEDILYGRAPFDNEIITIMTKYGIELDEVVAMINGAHTGPSAYLFSAPINLDTVEGICRSRAFVAKSETPLDPRQLIAELAGSQYRFPVKRMDEFWKLKNEIYSLVIHHPWCLLFDGLAQAFLEHHIDEFTPEDFFKTEEQLRQKKPELFHIFSWAKTSRRRALYRISDFCPRMLEYKVKAPQRDFFIDKNVDVIVPDDLSKRYTQKRRTRTVTVRELLGED